MLEHRRREPAPGVFRLVLPLPFPGLDRVNAYLLRGTIGCTLVDAGMFLPDEERPWVGRRRGGVRSVRPDKPADIDRLVVTHTHIDHYGMAGRFVDRDRVRAVDARGADKDLELYRHPEARVEQAAGAASPTTGVDDELDELTQFEDWRRFISRIVEPTTHVEEGDDVHGRGPGVAGRLHAGPLRARTSVCGRQTTDC